ncbi:pseudouridine synthase [Phlegmacium glaucopus]|nr:pseudouridine synthase [Phlegmacium glaucopus]
MSPTTAFNSGSVSYGGWSREKLIERLTLLENGTLKLPPVEAPVTPCSRDSVVQATKPLKEFEFARHSRRKIALKFCYSGWEYGGLAFQIGPTPLPTVENVLFDALAKARLVERDTGFDGCGWEKCGRTDRGVSAAGQVVSLWVRRTSHTNSISKSTKSHYEHDYLAILNRLLPDTIRIIAWSPVSTTFSARFSCKYRHYKYFFSPLNLDVTRMQNAASRMIGDHDFRNLCKLDPQKQITSFKRSVFSASIDPLDDRMYVFNLIGSAFLYHQVRHIMAILFLVGSGLEPPSVVTDLMNVEEGLEPPRSEDLPNEKYAVVDRKPEYQMADALPLMLWECGYDEAELTWRTTGKPDDEGIERGLANGGELYQQLQGIQTRSQVFSALNQHFLEVATKHHRKPSSLFPLKDGVDDLLSRSNNKQAMNIPLGGGTFKRSLKYMPLLERGRLDTVEVMNERWRLGKGMRKEERRQQPN